MNRSWWQPLLALCASGLLAVVIGCGGGGGNSPPDPQASTEPAPVDLAGTEQVVLNVEGMS